MRKSRGEEPNCDTCTPALLPENKDIVEVYLHCQGQVITAQNGGVIDINVQAVETMVERLGKDNDVFLDVLALARYFINKRQKS